MNLGITFEEKILKNISIDEYLNFCIEHKIAFLEFAPNFKEYSYEFYNNIFNKLKTLNIDIHFHLPYFADPNLDVSNFSSKTKEIFKFFYNFISKTSDKNIKLIFHGAIYTKTTKKLALKKTYNFIEFSLDYFNKNNLNITLSIETLNKHKQLIIGDSRKDLISIINKFNSPNLKTCWDLTHDYLNNNQIIIPNSTFINTINHCHVHGFNNKITHLPLNKTRLLNDYLDLIINSNLDINIELLYCDNYLTELKKDILYIKNMAR